MITIIGRRKAAKIFTAEAAHTPDWKLRRKKDREMKALAIELMDGKGYIVSSANELKRTYPDYTSNLPDSDETFIWGIKVVSDLRRNRLTFIPL